MLTKIDMIAAFAGRVNVRDTQVQRRAGNREPVRTEREYFVVPVMNTTSEPDDFMICVDPETGMFCVVDCEYDLMSLDNFALFTASYEVARTSWAKMQNGD